MFGIPSVKSWSIRWRLTAWYALNSLFILIVAGTVAFFAFRNIFIRQTDRSLTIKGMDVINSAVGSELFRRGQEYVVPPTSEGDVIANMRVQFESDSSTLTDWISPVGDPIYMRLLKTSPITVVVTSRNVKPHDLIQRTLSSNLRLSLDQTVDSYFTGQQDYERLRVVEIRVPRQPFVLQLATPWIRDQQVLDPLINIIVVIVGFGFALSALGGWLLVGRTLRPISEIVTEAERTGGNRLEPSFVAARTMADDEIGHLASALNEMMGRVHRALASQRQFTADASHDLRTPLTILRGEIELALVRDRSSEDYRLVLASSLEETDRLIRIVNDLAELASADIENEHRLHRRLVDVGDLCKYVVHSRRKHALSRNINISYVDEGVKSDPSILADELAIERAIGNLVDNAITYNVNGGSVLVSVKTAETNLAIDVSDTGNGISKEDRPHVFDRFYRADKARGGNAGINHSGLGLAIVKSVITAHDGEVSVKSTVGEGSVFTVILPLVDVKAATTLTSVD